MKLLVLDGNSLVNRAFYGIKILTTRQQRVSYNERNTDQQHHHRGK